MSILIYAHRNQGNLTASLLLCIVIKTVFVLSLILACIFIRCQSGEKKLPKEIQWISPKYSPLFQLGHTEKDSFLVLKNPEDTSRFLQVWHWGKTPHFEGCLRLKSIDKLVCMSAVFSGIAEELGISEKIVGMDNPGFATTPKMRKKHAEGGIETVAKEGQLNKEKLMRLKPDLVIAYFIDQKGFSEWEQLQKQGLPVLYCQNFLENHPLGRAEWLLAFGWLSGTFSAAQSNFSMIEEHYLSMKSAMQETDYKPAVFCNAPYSGIWDVPAGGSYMAALINDAGGDYLWKATKGTGRMATDIENVFKTAQNADIWLNPGACRELSCVNSLDSRLTMFSAFKQKQVYNHTAITTAQGGNAWWDYAVIRPDLVLHDLAVIFHPEKMNNQSLTFYEHLKP